MKLKETYQLERIAGQSVLLPSGRQVIDGGMVYRLNATGAWVMETLREERTEAELLRRAAEHYEPATEAERERLNADIRAFCDALRRLGLLEE